MVRSVSSRKVIFNRYSNCLYGVGLVVLLSSIFGRKIQLYFVGLITDKMIAPAIFLILFSILIFLFINRKNLAISSVKIALAFLLMCIGAILIYFKILVPIEAVHFVLFSSFGYFASASFGRTKGFWIVVCFAAGDEILQYYLPDRVGDLHDVVINSVSGIMGIFLVKRK